MDNSKLIDEIARRVTEQLQGSSLEDCGTPWHLLPDKFITLQKVRHAYNEGHRHLDFAPKCTITLAAKDYIEEKHLMVKTKNINSKDVSQDEIKNYRKR